MNGDEMEQFSIKEKNKNIFLQLGQIWEEENYAATINKIFGTNYEAYMRASLNLAKYGHDGVCAWFVFFDGVDRGHGGDLWANYITDNGKTLVEAYHGKYKVEKREEIQENVNVGQPIRLVFQRDPDSEGKPYKMKFLGVFKRVCYDDEKIIRYYEKIADNAEVWNINKK